MPVPAIFLDRDGTLMEEVHYCKDPEEVRLIAGVHEGLQSLKNAGYLTILVTNQGGIGKGLISISEYEAVHARFVELLGPGLLDAAYMCPDASHSPSPRRKPSPEMLLEAAGEWSLDLRRSWMIGDKDIDVKCGINAGVPSILVRTGHGRSASGQEATHVAENFNEAVNWLLDQERPQELHQTQIETTFPQGSP